MGWSMFSTKWRNDMRDIFMRFLRGFMIVFMIGSLILLSVMGAYAAWLKWGAGRTIIGIIIGVILICKMLRADE